MNRKRILAIDDTFSATRIVKVALEKTGRFEVRELNEPQQALAVAREFKPDLIVLDVCMPDVEGSELAEKITTDPNFSNTPIVFLTAIVTPREANKNGTLVVGNHEYIAKPARPDHIIACVDRHLAGDSRLGRTTEYVSHS